MTDDALLADLRALAEELGQQARWWQDFGRGAYAQGRRDSYDNTEEKIRGLLAKHAPEPDAGCVPCRVCGASQDRGWHTHGFGTPKPDVSERDELIRLIVDWRRRPADEAADVILAAGWRRR